MKTITQHLRLSLLSRVGGLDPHSHARESLSSLRLSEWSPQFETLMRNRLLMGRFRYGRMDRKEERNYDRVGSMTQRLSLYQKTGNLEHLVDVANLAMMEFEHGEHPFKHFEAADDGVHTAKVETEKEERS